MGCYVLGNPNGEKVQHPTSLQTPFRLSSPREIPVPGLDYLGLCSPAPLPARPSLLLCLP